MQEAPIHQSHVFGQIKISQTNFEKGHPRNIPAKLFQNLTSSFGEEDLLRISSCPKKPQFTRAMFMDGSKFREQVLKRVTQGTFLWNYFKIWPAVSEKKIFSCPYSARSPHSPEPCLWMDQNFADNFWKGSPKEHSCEIISKSDQRFRRRRFFKNFFMSIKCKKPPFTTAMFMEGSKFREQFLKRVTQGTFLWNNFKIRPAVSEKKIF